LSKTHPSIEMTCIRFVSDELSSTFGSRFHLEMISCLA
jgi:hypothetical protein